MRARACLGCLLLVGCSSVILDPGEHSSSAAGPSSSQAATPASASASSASGAGGGGSDVTSGTGGLSSGGEGGGVEPLPGCETLVWDEPFTIPLGSWRHRPALAPRGDGDVGLVLVDQLDSGLTMLSTILREPFGAWPPAVEELIAVHGIVDPGGTRQVLSSRPDGTYASHVEGTGESVVAHLGEPGATLVASAWPLYVDREQDGGAYGIRWASGFDRYDALAEGATARDVGTHEFILWDVPRAAILDDGVLMVGDPRPDDPDALDTPGTIELTRVSPQGAGAAATLRLDRLGYYRSLAPRPGGAWWLEASRDWIDVVPIDQAGALAGRVLTPPIAPGHYDEPTLAVFGDAFALAFFRTGNLEVVLSDGIRVSQAAQPLPEPTDSNQRISAVASVDARALLLTYDSAYGVVVTRVRCQD